VTITSAATLPATGTVTFLDNGVSIGTGPLSGSPATASLLISTLAVGTHPITVTYAGDAYNSSASSAPVSQVVDQGQTATTVTLATPNPGIAGTTETISATVALTSGSAPLTALSPSPREPKCWAAPRSLRELPASRLRSRSALPDRRVLPASNANAGASTSVAFPYSVVLGNYATTLVVAPSPEWF